MDQVNREPVVIEDLVKFGEDRGFKKGLKKGFKKGLKKNVRRVLALRKLALSAEQERRIGACNDLATLERWLDQAVFAESADEALR